MLTASARQRREDGVLIAAGAEGRENAEIVITMLPGGTCGFGLAEVLPSSGRDAVHRLLDHRRRVRAENACPGRRARHCLARRAGFRRRGGAKAATLTFMVGGTDARFFAGKAGSEKMGKRIVHCGDAGTARRRKSATT